MGLLKKRIKGSTLIEGIVSMVIILTCATIAFTVLTKQKRGINSAIRVQAETNMVFIAEDVKKSGKLLNNSYTLDNMRIELQFTPYRNYKNLYILSCEAYNLQDEFIGDYFEIIKMTGKHE